VYSIISQPHLFHFTALFFLSGDSFFLFHLFFLSHSHGNSSPKTSGNTSWFSATPAGSAEEMYHASWSWSASGSFSRCLAKRTCHTNLSWCILALWPNRHTWNLSSRSAARHFLYRLGCGPSCLSVSRKQRGLRFVQKQRLLDYFFARIVSFIPWVPYGGYFLSSAATLRLFSAHTRALKK